MHWVLWAIGGSLLSLSVLPELAAYAPSLAVLGAFATFAALGKAIFD